MGEPRGLGRKRGQVDAVRLMQRVAVVANEASSLADAIQAALDEVCGYSGWPVGHAYITRPGDPPELLTAGLWHIDDERRFEDFREVTERTTLRGGEGLPGRVLSSGKPAWIADVTRDPNFPRARADVDIVVRCGFATPVLVGRHVAAVLEFFCAEVKGRDDRLLELMGYVGTQIGRVAEREMATAALLAQVEQRQRLIDLAYDAFVSIDGLGRITGWNRAAEQMFGWASEDVMRLPLAATIVPHRLRERHLIGLARYQATGRSAVLNKRIELPALHRDGHEFPVEVAVWPVEHEGGTTFCALIHDITQRKLDDERSKLDHERLASAQEMAAVGSWEWDIENNAVTWSEQMYRNFGVSPESFEPSLDTYMQLVHPDDRAMVMRFVTRTLDRLSPFEFDHRSVRADGSVHIHHCTGRVVVKDGRAILMAGTNQDITDLAVGGRDAGELLSVVEDLLVQSPNQPASPDEGEPGSAA